MNARLAIYTVLEQFEKHPGNLERLIDRNLTGLKFNRRDRAFVFEIVFGVVRNKIRLEFIISEFLDDKELAHNSSLMRVLLIGAYQIIYLDRIPNHAAVNETVKLAKSSKQTIKFSGLVNAILRKVIQSQRKLPSPSEKMPLAERLSIEYSHPQWIVSRWLKNIGLSNTKKLLAFNNTIPETYLRRKIRGIARQTFDIESKPIAQFVGEFHNLYYKMTKRIDEDAIALLQHGYCTVQSPSSGWVVSLLELESTDHCLDLCSAPGGKASLMAELANEGTVIGAELKFNRLEKVIDVMIRLNLTNLHPLVADGTKPPFTKRFDKVLLDSPCSGTGVLHRHPDARSIRTEENITNISQTQRELLESAGQLVKPGGLLVYSTCSLEPEENEEQISFFLKNNTQFVLEKPHHTFPQRYIDNYGYLRITPYEHQLDGIFAAKLRKRY